MAAPEGTEWSSLNGQRWEERELQRSSVARRSAGAAPRAPRAHAASGGPPGPAPHRPGDEGCAACLSGYALLEGHNRRWQERCEILEEQVRRVHFAAASAQQDIAQLRAENARLRAALGMRALVDIGPTAAAAALAGPARVVPKPSAPAGHGD